MCMVDNEIIPAIDTLVSSTMAITKYNKNKVESVQLATMVYTHLPYEVKRALPSELVWLFVWFISDVNPLAKHSSPLI